MKYYNFPKVNYNLCPRPESKWRLARHCRYEGLLGAFGKCLAPGVRRGAKCPPIVKYRKDLRKITEKK